MLKGAHGTLVVDPSTDTVYWGLQDIGWISVTEKLSRSAIIPQDASFKAGNLHGADLLPRRGKAPDHGLQAVAQGRELEVPVWPVVTCAGWRPCPRQAVRVVHGILPVPLSRIGTMRTG